ncbi:hypothetical protein GJV14_23805 [Enterobacteriaceae bacterium RIT697]|nr:hypothetical protein [Enterobacteriaceae bacterium RIT697]
MDYLIKGWTIAATIYTCLNVCEKLRQLFPDEQLTICIICTCLNVAINVMLFSYPNRGRD